jgi:hypothetical protein
LNKSANIRRRTWVITISAILTVGVCITLWMRWSSPEHYSPEKEPFNSWYGYQVGTVLEAADMDGGRNAAIGGILVKLKPKGNWPWDEAYATLAPDNTIIGLEFHIQGCEPIMGIWESGAPPRKCSKSVARMTALAEEVRQHVTRRIVTASGPDKPTSDALQIFDPSNYQGFWSFEKNFVRCEGFHPRYASAYLDSTGKVGSIGVYAARDSITLHVEIADRARYPDFNPSTGRWHYQLHQRQAVEDLCLGEYFDSVPIVVNADTTHGANPK